MEGKNEEVRIGVYVCHCGLNIAGAVEVSDVAKFAATLPDVVIARDYRYSCSDPGQAMIKNDIQQYRLNRVIVAACSPRMHETTFRNACKEAGLNPYLFEMANIREHCSWVHPNRREEATQKAKDLVKMAVARARHLRPQEELEVPITRSALVIGGGVAGIQAALDLADTGYKVYLVEKEPTIGGRMAQLDKTFPTMDCSICILGPKMVEVSKHPHVTLLTLAEVKEISGYIGNFTVKVYQKPRYVTRDCSACGECAKVCPVTLPNEFDVGLAYRNAIYIPFPQAVPPVYLIDREACLSRGPIGCHNCYDACQLQKQCIDFDDQPKEHILNVGTIIVATGMDALDPSELREYGYGIYPNVITSLEFERLINAAGPSKGMLIRPSDRKIPRRVAFIQCVGSRALRNGVPYCSNVCCMNTVKDALLIREHWPSTEIYVFYMDIRAFGKGFEALYRRSREEGVIYIRGKPSRIVENNDQTLTILAEDTVLGEPVELDADMVILSIGLVPRKDADIIQQLLALARTEEGFFLEAHPKLKPVDTAVGGVFLAGCVEGPKDIKDSVTQASAAAARAGILMAKGKITVEALTPILLKDKCTFCGLCAKVCPFHAWMFTPGVKKHPELIAAACQGCGTCGAECPSDALYMRHFPDEAIYAQIDALAEEEPERKILCFACNWCSYAGSDLAGVSRMVYPPSVRIIRTMCSGRVSMDFVLHALRKKVGLVLVSGCHIGDCHYNYANLNTKRRVENLWKRLEKKGVSLNRVHLEWFSAAEGQQFARKISELDELLHSIPLEQIHREAELLMEKRPARAPTPA
ncbi:MAG: CoB-CoM heterodisulfide reductase HdrA2 [bacterium JZ-2024 1]